MSSQDRERLFDQVEVCGKNRGPHKYIPAAWRTKKEGEETLEVVTVLLCTNCFCRVNTYTIFEHYPEFKLPNINERTGR